MGYGKRKFSDQVAVESMREELNKLKMRGKIVFASDEKGSVEIDCNDILDLLPAQSAEVSGSKK